MLFDVIVKIVLICSSQWILLIIHRSIRFLPFDYLKVFTIWINQDKGSISKCIIGLASNDKHTIVNCTSKHVIHRIIYISMMFKFLIDWS